MTFSFNTRKNGDFSFQKLYKVLLKRKIYNYL